MVFAGRTVEIKDVTLVAGQIHFVAEPLFGPLPDLVDTRLTIFGQDGQGILQTELFNLSAVPAGSIISLTYDAKVVCVDETTVHEETRHL